MSLSIASLNSGSNGNCYYVGNDGAAILIDAGISCRETERRLSGLGIAIRAVKAIFISHEHTDHIKGLAMLAGKYALPVYLSRKTYETLTTRPESVRFLEPGAWVSVAGLRVYSFEKYHDACDPHSFLVADPAGTTVGIFTDIGTVCAELSRCFQLCHAAFLEANYDEQMLEQSRYPFYLKRRISGGKGHLSNSQALQLFQRCKPPFMTHLVLAHLSGENNHPDRVASLFAPHAGSVHIHVASRQAASPLFRVGTHEKDGGIAAPLRQGSLFP